jgi:hypothetical protein
MMQAAKRKWMWFLIILAIVALSVWLLHYFLSPRLHNRYVESAVTRFQSQPSQAHADVLVSLVDNQHVTPEQGKRILELLFRPKITKRKAYPLGETPWISVEPRFNVSFRHMMVPYERYVWVDGENQYGSSSPTGGSSFNTRPQFYVLHPEPAEPGTYRMEIRYKYSLIAHSRTSTAWGWNPFRGRFPRNLLPRKGMRIISSTPPVDPNYVCEFTVPVEVAVVENEKAENVTLISDPELDRSMQAAFTTKIGRMSGTYSTSAGKREYSGGIQIYYNNIPAAAAFQHVFQFPDGREVVEKPHREEPIRLRAKSSGMFFASPRVFLLEQPGQYSGTLILRPSIEAAYRDPAIKSIWNGELKFPISFTVDVVEQQP